LPLYDKKKRSVDPRGMLFGEKWHKVVIFWEKQRLKSLDLDHTFEDVATIYWGSGKFFFALWPVTKPNLAISSIGWSPF
jgi:hypothetical protein